MFHNHPFRPVTIKLYIKIPMQQSPTVQLEIPPNHNLLHLNLSTSPKNNKNANVPPKSSVMLTMAQHQMTSSNRAQTNLTSTLQTSSTVFSATNLTATDSTSRIKHRTPTTPSHFPASLLAQNKFHQRLPAPKASFHTHHITLTKMTSPHSFHRMAKYQTNPSKQVSGVSALEASTSPST